MLALVKFVENDGAEVGEQRIVLQPRRQHAFGHDQQPRVGAEAALETDLPADLAAERPAALGGDARGDRARGDAAWLQQDDAVRRTAAPAARGWSCPRRAARDDDRRARPPDDATICR